MIYTDSSGHRYVDPGHRRFAAPEGCTCDAWHYNQHADPGCPFYERPENERPAERIAREFHEEYERLAPCLGYETRSDSAVPWPEVPEQNRRLMVNTVQALLDRGIIR